MAVAGESSTTPAVVLSAAALKKEEEAKAERERKYPGPVRRGVVLAAEKKVTSKLLEKDMGSSEKVYLVNSCVTRLSRCFLADENSNILSAVAGITADANSLVNYARNAAQVRCIARWTRR